MKKPTTIHEEVKAMYGKKPSERINEIIDERYPVWRRLSHEEIVCRAIIQYLDEQAGN